MSEKDKHSGAPGVARIRKGIALIVVGAALVTFALAIIGPSEDLTPGKVAGVGAVDSSWSRGSARELPRIVVPTEKTQHECQPGPSHAPAMTIAERELARKYVRGEFEGAAWKVGEAVYLEWGGGGPTSAFGTLAARAYTVEHGRVVRRDSRVARDAMHERARLLAPLLPRPGGAAWRNGAVRPGASSLTKRSQTSCGRTSRPRPNSRR